MIFMGQYTQLTTEKIKLMPQLVEHTTFIKETILVESSGENMPVNTFLLMQMIMLHTTTLVMLVKLISTFIVKLLIK